RLDQLEQALEAAGNSPAHLVEEAGPVGLPLESPFPAFTFPDLAGNMVALADFRGKSVVLVHWNFECGFCDLIAPELSRLHADLQQRNVQMVLLSYGDAESNRTQALEHGLKCPILLMSDKATIEPFEQLGTPAAYLLDGDGRVAARLAVGADAVPELVRAAAGMETDSPAATNGKPERKKLSSERSLTESRIERNGLPAGTPAPSFNLPDLQGRLISLEAYRGRRVLLVFSDPHCGPCDELAPDLVRLHREWEDQGLDLVLVGRGRADENREKAEQHSFLFPVVLQEKWNLSKQYGIFATPVAFLIDENGIIAKDVAVGRDAILALADSGLAAKAGPR
ncbi:MAG: TlpA family protein disulfide reductase, partial [Candidatus Eremiobacteraeota bacterium]|nr:TlpA family protein disulfide reductase [Candidatus Eremiobacteraeota bacterium]